MTTDHQQTTKPTRKKRRQEPPNSVHAVNLDIYPPLPAGKVMVILVRKGACFSRVVADDAKILDPLFEGVFNNAT